MFPRPRYDDKNRPPRKPFQKPNEIWGTINMDEGAGRRVYLRFSQRITMTQLKDFFKDLKLVGIKLYSTYAYVEFERPNDVDRALVRDGRRIGTIVIQVQICTPRREKHKTRTENYGSTSSRHRDGISSDSDRQAIREAYRTSIRSNKEPTNSNNQLVLATEQRPDFESQPQVQPRALPQPQQNHHRWPVGDLPADIELSLKFVIEQKTAKNLSAIQIHDIMRYFEYSKGFVSSNNSLHLQLPQVPYNHEQVPLRRSSSTGTTAGFGSLASVPISAQLTSATSPAFSTSLSNSDYVSSQIPAQLCIQATPSSSWFHEPPQIMAIADANIMHNNNNNHHHQQQQQQQQQLQLQLQSQQPQQQFAGNQGSGALTSHNNQAPSSSLTATLTTTSTTTIASDPKKAKECLDLLKAAWKGG